MSLYRHLGSGPGFMSFANYNYDACEDVWWTNLAYVTNFYPISNQVSTETVYFNLSNSQKHDFEFKNSQG